MTGRTFTRFLLLYLLVLTIGTVALDFTLRTIAGHEMVRRAGHSAQALYGQNPLGPEGRAVLVDAGPAAKAVLQHRIMRGADVDDGRLYATARAGQAVVQPGSSLQGVQFVLDRLRSYLLIGFLILLAAGIAAAGYVARRMARRAKRVTAFAGRLGAGELSARMEEADLDAMPEVAQALNAAASRLERSFRNLESRQRELAALLDSMQEAVVAVGPDGLVKWSNTVMRQIAPGAVREGRPLVQTIRDPEVLACVDEALQRRELRSGKARSVAPGRTFEINAAPTPDGGVVAVLHDVTEIERAETMRRDFVANVSHEMRTPLTSISGYVETLLDTTEGLPGHVREFLGIILKNATRMNRLTEDLLALANVESGEYRLKMQPVPASTLMTDTLESLGGILVDSGVEVQVRNSTDTMVTVDVDAMTQVFGNLIENAMKYADAGKRVVVGVRDVAGGVEFSVRDFGPGIAVEHQERIFERFYRVDKARSRESGGTGLGLAIAKHIVRAHGGTIQVESELGAGATFIFCLPAVGGEISGADGNEGAEQNGDDVAEDAVSKQSPGEPGPDERIPDERIPDNRRKQ